MNEQNNECSFYVHRQSFFPLKFNLTVSVASEMFIISPPYRSCNSFSLTHRLGNMLGKIFSAVMPISRNRQLFNMLIFIDIKMLEFFLSKILNDNNTTLAKPFPTLLTMPLLRNGERT